MHSKSAIRDGGQVPQDMCLYADVLMSVWWRRGAQIRLQEFSKWGALRYGAEAHSGSWGTRGHLMESGVFDRPEEMGFVGSVRGT